MEHDPRLASLVRGPAPVRGQAYAFVPPPFTITHDRTARLLRWTLRGFWEADDARDFMAAMRTEISSLGRPPQRWNGLGDAREFPIQSPEVSDLMRRGPAGSLRHDGRIAIVVGSMLGKLQATRSLDDPKTRCFLTMEEACAWLGMEPA